MDKLKQSLIKQTYATELYTRYRGYIKLQPSLEFSFPQTHICHICSNIFKCKKSTMMRGSGCPKCLTKTKSALDLHRHLEQLTLVRGNKFKMLGIPPRFKETLKVLYSCTGCKAQIIATATEILNVNFCCKLCCNTVLKTTKILKNEAIYQKRLDAIYTPRLFCPQGYRAALKTMLHVCSGCNKKIRASSRDTLLGKSVCTACSSQVNFNHKLRIVLYRNTQFALRHKIEYKALKALCGHLPPGRGRLSSIFSGYEYPIPFLGQNHLCSFYLKSENRLIDIFQKEKLEKKRGIIALRHAQAKDLGYAYGVVVVDSDYTATVQTKDSWLCGENTRSIKITGKKVTEQQPEVKKSGLRL